MFICEEDHEKAGYEGFHIATSRGPCEVCGKVADCYDCQCYRHKLEKEEEA